MLAMKLVELSTVNLRRKIFSEIFNLSKFKTSGHIYNDNKLDGIITYIKWCCYLKEIFSVKIYNVISTQL
jgi:hypothetical protein